MYLKKINIPHYYCLENKCQNTGPKLDHSLSILQLSLCFDNVRDDWFPIIHKNIFWDSEVIMKQNLSHKAGRMDLYRPKWNRTLPYNTTTTSLPPLPAHTPPITSFTAFTNYLHSHSQTFPSRPMLPPPSHVRVLLLCIHQHNLHTLLISHTGLVLATVFYLYLFQQFPFHIVSSVFT